VGFLDTFYLKKIVFINSLRFTPYGHYVYAAVSNNATDEYIWTHLSIPSHGFYIFLSIIFYIKFGKKISITFFISR